MNTTAPVVVIGGGHAAAAFADKFRNYDETTPVIIFSEENELPYHRPPLSKKYLLGEMPVERLRIRAPEWYGEKGVEVRLESRVAAINPAAQTITLADGSEQPYRDLLIATGSRPRELPAAIGGDLSGVLTLRDIADVDRMQPYFVAGKKLVIVGGGYIGLEAAAVASKLGMTVTLLEMTDRILQRVAAPETSTYFRELHREHGVMLLESTSLAALQGDDQGHVTAAELSNGDVLDADVVLVGIGGIANVELADAAGIKTDNGVLVDAHCRSSAAHIYAVGDCCNFDYLGQPMRFESVQNANAQADIAAKNIAGDAIAYEPQPWFWSDQYEVKLQIAGCNINYDQVVARAGDKSGAYSVWYFREGDFIAVDAMNDPASFAMGKKMLANNQHPDSNSLADQQIALKDIVASATQK